MYCELENNFCLLVSPCYTVFSSTAQMAFILYLLLTATFALFTGKARSEPCSADLTDKCRELISAHYSTVEALGWPITDEIVNASHQLAHDYCRAANASAHCLFNLPIRCAHDPELLQRFTQDGLWYTAEMANVVAKTCQLPISTLRFVRALEHCSRQRSDLLVELLGLDRDLSAAAWHNATSARHNVCQYLYRFTAAMDGAAKAEMTEKCGRIAVEVLRDGHQQLHEAHCSP
ncbi:uncharacterized protein LOC129599032 [Paramacrobiotus metropolitanus]|uniref:uncharacterized protein LOC129599032 n=1 Tax=Paramacrobiotus metropolitanus TaxID=2943436 RepID=UPI00244652D5|nr:uncharacterized protein LOC129599032 [Paramacrobiotus metropolitanus]